MKKTLLSISVTAMILFLSACSFNFSSARITDVKMCTHVSNNQCASDNPTFTRNTPEIYVSCHLKNAPENTKVRFDWNYYGQKKFTIRSLTLNSGNKTGTLNLQASLSRPNNGWPVGEYEVVITLVGLDKEPVVKKFTVQ